jgi:hypothetical protein
MFLHRNVWLIACRSHQCCHYDACAIIPHEKGPAEVRYKAKDHWLSALIIQYVSKKTFFLSCIWLLCYIANISAFGVSNLSKSWENLLPLLAMSWSNSSDKDDVHNRPECVLSENLPRLEHLFRRILGIICCPSLSCEKTAVMRFHTQLKFNKSFSIVSLPRRGVSLERPCI